MCVWWWLCVCVAVWLCVSTQECLLCQHLATVAVVVVSPAWSETDTAAFIRQTRPRPFKRRKVNNGQTLIGG